MDLIFPEEIRLHIFTYIPITEKMRMIDILCIDTLSLWMYLYESYKPHLAKIISLVDPLISSLQRKRILPLQSYKIHRGLISSESKWSIKYSVGRIWVSDWINSGNNKWYESYVDRMGPYISSVSIKESKDVFLGIIILDAKKCGIEPDLESNYYKTR